jgi:hypothetical protein
VLDHSLHSVIVGRYTNKNGQIWLYKGVDECNMLLK